MDNLAFKPEYNLLEHAFLGYPLEKYFFPKLSILAQLAKEEPWDFKTPKFKDPSNPYPILYNYFNYTYDRLFLEGKIAISDDKSAMCFNTGLQTYNEEDIFALFSRNNKYPHETNKQWWFVKFCVQSDREMVEKFNKPPEIANYIENAADLVFDKKLLPIKIYYDHIIDDNYDRFVSVIGIENKHMLSQLLQVAVQRGEQRAIRNYKIAIPQLYTDKISGNSKIQLLLPLFIQSPSRADLALVVEKVNAGNSQAYIGKTVLPLDWAYMNSRRIVRPDIDWISII